MGEEEKKAEGKKAEGEEKKQEAGEKKAEGGGGGEKKDEKKADEGKKEGDGGEKKAEGGGGEGEGQKKETPPPPPPEEIVMRVYMHCEGCARKVRRSLKGFEGVEDVMTDCRTHKVLVKGKVAAADPLKIVDRVQKKSGRRVELLTPIPPKPEKKEEKKDEEKEKPKPEEKKEEPPVIGVVLKVHMHCEACSEEIKKRIPRMKGVQSAELDLKNSQVTVTGVFEPPQLVEYIYKRTGKHAVVVKAEPLEKKPDDKPKDEAGKEEKQPEGSAGDKDKAAGGGEGEKKAGGGGEGKKEKEEGDGGAAAPAPDDPAAVAAAMAMAAAKLGEVSMNPLYGHYYPLYHRYQAERNVYAPQLFSDENPNACSVL